VGFTSPLATRGFLCGGDGTGATLSTTDGIGPPKPSELVTRSCWSNSANINRRVSAPSDGANDESADGGEGNELGSLSTPAAVAETKDDSVMLFTTVSTPSSFTTANIGMVMSVLFTLLSMSVVVDGVLSALV